MKRPLLVFDGDCGFCRRWIERWRARTGERVDYEPYQTAAARFKDVPRERFERSVQWFGPEGRAEGAEAVFRLLDAGAGRGFWLRAYRRLPGFAPCAEAVYRCVAAHRVLFSKLDRILLGADLAPPDDRPAFWLMIRLLGLVHLAAFASLWTQAAGLWGREGILPIAEYLAAARSQLGPAAYRYLPTLFWLGSGDGALRAACAAGCLLSVCLALGWAAGPALLGLWALYLSFLSAGREFMSFQWDILLLETTFLLMLCAPWRLKPDLRRWAPPRAGVWLTRLLLFRLMFESGAVKLLSGDPSWRSLTALRYHFETQPLPTWLGWYAHQLPLSVQKGACLILFVIELLVPFFIFLGRGPRYLAFWPLVALQVLIALTGNYCFFNLITILLCLSLVGSLGDHARRVVPVRSGSPKPSLWSAPVFAVIFVIGFFQLLGFAGIPTPNFIRSVTSPLAPLALVNQYGLFAVMTTARTEIVIEGSDDGRSWKEYEFKWKPGEPARRPRFVAPHQPRLDWQMWFAALGPCRDNEWLVRFMVRLLEGSKPVSGLLSRDPFEGSGPAFIRSTAYDYRFTRRGQSGWWRRDHGAPYCPTLASRSKTG